MPLTIVHQSPARDLRDFYIENLVFDLVVAHERIVALETDAAAERELVTDAAVYRELALATFDALLRVTHENQALRADTQRQRDMCRWLREEILLRAGADDPEAP